MVSLRRGIGRIVEFFGGVTLLVVASPLLFLAVILVLIDRVGPVLYRQERYGLNRTSFQIYKFRTMPVGAEQEKPVWGKEIDPRASAIGNFLRRTHIDEIPQLLNVITGNMSLIGPRPERPYFADLFEEVIPDYSERFLLKPGITGWAQVHGFRGDSCVEERTRFDVYYVRNKSFILDLFILFMTPFALPVQSMKKTRKIHERIFSQKGLEPAGSIPFTTPHKKA
jgi:lipopolysaccharide/colanic/teichoic acid biosynthesis glycosyltransferase